MKRTVQQRPGKSIGQTPDAHSGNSYPALTPVYNHWSDLVWHDSKLPPGLSNRLARIDRYHQASIAVASVLARDSRMLIAQENAGEQHHGLTHAELEGMHLALRALHIEAEKLLGEIRDDEVGIA